MTRGPKPSSFYVSKFIDFIIKKSKEENWHHFLLKRYKIDRIDENEQDAMIKIYLLDKIKSLSRNVLKEIKNNDFEKAYELFDNKI